MPGKKPGGEKTVKKRSTVKKAVSGKTKTRVSMIKPAKESRINLENYLDEVKKRAYELFLERGAAHGDNLSDWLKAESEIKRKYGLR